MNLDLVNTIIKIFAINVFVFFVFIKMIGYRGNKLKVIVNCIFGTIIIVIIHILLKNYISILFLFVIEYSIQLLFFRIITNDKQNVLMIPVLISNAVVYILFAISIMIEAIPKLTMKIDNTIINLCLIIIIELFMILLLLKIRRIKNGLEFLKAKTQNDYLDIIMINVSTMIIFSYSLFAFAGYEGEKLTRYQFATMILLGIIMTVMIQKTIILYYKQVLLKKELKKSEEDIKEKDQEIKKLSEERYEISRINHEFYNRQKALEQKVKEMETEASSEIGVIDRIENLTKEYSKNLEDIKGKEKLPLTEIPEIDDMFKYMQTECSKNNIEFKLHIESEIYHLINKIIPKNKLETLIGDHLRNAIIAINSSKNKNKSILVMLGKIEGKYELCIYDSGIEFEIKTLEKLGTERITTHKETGGSGIGFMTTFQTLKECKASLVIEEKHKESENDYTKAIKIKFDGKNEYKIISYRAEKLKKEIEDGLTKVKILDEIAESKESVKL